MKAEEREATMTSETEKRKRVITEARRLQGREAMQRYRLSHKEKVKASRDAWREAHPEYFSSARVRRANVERMRLLRRNPAVRHKILAVRKLNHALESGKVKKLPCQQCGSTKRPEAHHPDYSKPLEVTWLCRDCHIQIHRRKA